MRYYEKTYGEIVDLEFLYNHIKIIISSHNKNLSDYLFYDLGSGYGKIVNFFSNYCKKSIGIEIEKDKYEESLCFNAENIFFYNQNFFDHKLEPGCILLINNLCFGPGTNKRLSMKILNECSKGDIILVSKKMDLLEDYFLNFITLECTWGESEIYFYIL